MEEERWKCDNCGRTLHPSSLTRVGIGVHHYNEDKARLRDDSSGLLNCGLVRRYITALAERTGTASGLSTTVE